MNKPERQMLTDPVGFLTQPREPVNPIDLSTVPRDEWIHHIDAPILPTAAVQAYLDADDDFDQSTVNAMEEVLERHYSIKPPFHVAGMTSELTGRMQVEYFVLGHE
jgi:hypothetical protein